MGKTLCPECNFAYPDHARSCPVGSIAKKKAFKKKDLDEEFAEEVVKWGKIPTPRPRPFVKMRMDGTTWMVSVIHPDKPGGSAYHDERAGNSALQAAQSYYNDSPLENKGAALCRDSPELTIICVIGQEIAASGKPWHVSLFALDEDNKIIPFP